jgi:translation initiation factor 1 (eIF-1/SUI1)
MAKPTITTRYGKGSQLTWQELDDNFTNLQNTTLTLTSNGTSSDVSLGDTITFIAGTNVTLGLSGNSLTINSSAGSSYTLPVATSSVLGGVKPDGTTITVGVDGTISAAAATYTSIIKQLVKNTTGSTILKGQAVYIQGSSGQHVTVALAQANTEGTSSKTIGLAETNIANNGTGYIITDGQIVGVDTHTATDGDAVWLSPTVAGGLLFGLANKPVAPNHMVYLGVVEYANNNGKILIKVQNSYELEEFSDVLITNPTTNDWFGYDNVTSLWKNKQLPTASTTTAGVVKVDGTTITITNGIISGAAQTSAGVGFDAVFLLGGL